MTIFPGLQYRQRLMRFLITPHAGNAYDVHMVEGLASGFRKIGHEAVVMQRPLAERESVEACQSHAADVLFQVNRCRPTEPRLPAGVRHVAWYQDPIMPSDIAQRVHEDDIVYFIVSSPDFAIDAPCKTSFLSTGVDEDALTEIWPKRLETVDFSMVGYIPPPLNPATENLSANSAWPALAEQMAAVVEKSYRPLSGSLNIRDLAGQLPGEQNEQLFFAREYPRLLDRVLLVQEALKVSKSVALYGAYWDTHPEFRPYFKGVIHEHGWLLRAFKDSRINLANNTHGLGLHSRVLECMAIGQFIAIHPSASDNAPGGIRTSFEPGFHYGEYSAETIADDLARWLHSPIRRWIAGQRARREIMQRHLWRHRAAQIVSDLAV